MTIKFIDKSELIIGSATVPENVTFRFSDILKLGGGGSQPSWQDIVLSGNGSLTLTNAKANSLNYLKLFGDTEQLAETYIDSVTLDGKCEQSRTPTPSVPVDIVCNNGTIKAKRQSGLPLGYQMVEWLKSTGGIVITGFKTKSTQEIETVFYRERSGASYLYSSDTATGGTTNTTAYLTSGAGNWRWDGKSYSINVPTGIEVTSIQKNDGVWLNGTKSGWYSDAADFVSTNDLRLSSSENTTVRIYSQTIREGDTVTLDLVPVQRLSDSSYGFYDKVSGEFYTNTEATFVAGDVIDDPVEIYTDGTIETATDNLGNVATAEMLLSVGDYKDTQEVLTGAVTRNVGIKVLDGTETITASSSGAMIIAIPDVSIGATNNPRNTHFGLETSATSIGLGKQRFGSNGDKIYSTNYYMKPLTTMTVAAFKQWLADQYNAGTPVIIIYPLATATTETVTGQFLSKEPVTVTGSLTGLVANVVSSSHTTPTPTQPLPINTNNGVLKVNSQGQIYTDGTVETVEVVKNYFSREDETTGQIIGSDGTVSNNANYCISAIVTLPAGNYTCSWDQGAGGSRPFSVYKCDSNGNVIATRNGGQLFYELSGTGTGSFTVDTKTTARMSYRSTISVDSVVLLEIGTATAEMLLKVDNYQDEQNVINGHIVRNVGIKVLDGTENWTQISGSSAPFALVVNDFVSLGLAGKVIVYSTHFQGVPASTTWSNYENLISFTTGTGSDNRTFRVRYLSNTKTLAEFKQFLAEQYAQGTPVICVYYKISTTETVTGQHLHIQAGTNTVAITQASIDNLGLEVSYKGTV